MSPDAQYSKTSPLREYVSVIARRRWWLIGSILLCVTAATAWTYLSTPLYQADAQLTYQKQPDISSALMGGTSLLSSADVARELETYANLVTSDVIARLAAQELGVASGQTTGAEVFATAIKDTSILKISAVSSDPAVAQEVANAYATTFSEWSLNKSLDAYRSAEDIIKAKMAQYDTPEAQQDPAYLSLASRLQDVKILESTATGNVDLAAPAPLPTAPSSPNHPRDIVLGLLAGLLIGLVVVAVVEQLDVTVHTPEDFGRAVQLPVLARLPRVPRELAQDSSLLTLTTPGGNTAEAFRMLRGNLEFVDIDGNLDTVVVTSCREGEGKTTTACNLAVTLARSGKRVIVVDCDLRRPRVHHFFGLNNRDGVSTVAAGKTALRDALKAVPVPSSDYGAERGGTGAEAQHIKVLTSGPLPPNPGEIVTSHRLAGVIEELAANSDMVLIDAPPFLAVGDAAALARSVDGLLLVMRLGTVTKSMLREAGDFLGPLPCRKLGIVATNVTSESSAYRYKYYHDKSEGRADAGDITAPLDQLPAEPLSRA